MGDVIKLPHNRATQWTIEEALEHTLEKIRDGSYCADRIYIALCQKPVSGNKASLSYIMAGMEVPEALGWLHLHMDFLASDGDWHFTTIELNMFCGWRNPEWMGEAPIKVERKGPPLSPWTVTVGLRILNKDGKRKLQQRWTRLVSFENSQKIEEKWVDVPIVSTEWGIFWLTIFNYF